MGARWGIWMWGCWLCWAPLGAWAQGAPAPVSLTTRKVIVFKDGYCLFHKTTAGKTDAAGEYFTGEVPDSAVLGSFWAVPRAGSLVSVRSGWETVISTATKEVPVSSVLETLVANQGARARLVMQDKETITGVIDRVLTTPTQEGLNPALAEIFGVPQAELPGTPEHALLTSSPGAARPSSARVASYLVSGVAGQHVILKTDEGDVLLPIGAVNSVMIEEMKHLWSRTLTTTERTKRLTFRFDAPEQQRELDLLYFRPGLRWIPTYRVELSPDPKVKTARMALQAEILNEAEPLAETPLDIVVGVPNFRFRELPSPLVLEAALRNTLAVAAPALMGGNFRQSLSNSLYTQRAGEFRREAVEGNAALEGGEIPLPGELTAGGAQDLFVYRLPPLSLKTGERIAVNIFSADKLPYRDVYTWDLRVTRADIDAAPSGSGAPSPLKLSNNEVWHQIELTNQTQLPWTTGAVMLMQGDQPLAQELLTYTSPKDACRVPVTVSVETRGSFDERETGRDLKALTWDGYSYAKISKEARLHLCNNKSIPIETEITLRLGGKVTEATDEGSVTLSAYDASDWTNYRGHPAVNNSSRVTWKVKLDPGETFEPTVQYHYYTRQ